MEHFVEFVLELLFGLAKDIPDKKPEMEYIDHFIVKHPRRKTVSRICATLIIVVVFSFLWILIKHETRYLFAIFVGLGIMLFALSLFAFSFKCDIDDSRCLSGWKFGPDAGMCPAEACCWNPMGQQEIHEHEAPGDHGNGNHCRVIAVSPQSVKGKTGGVPPPLTLCALTAEK